MCCAPADGAATRRVSPLTAISTADAAALRYPWPDVCCAAHRRDGPISSHPDTNGCTVE